METTKRTKKFTETKIAKNALKVGDTFWFSGYWCVVTRFANNKLYGRFPYTPSDKDIWLSWATPSPEYEAKYGPMMVTVLVASKDGAK